MRISSKFDPEQGVIILSFTSNLFEKYYQNFGGMIKSKKDAPKGLKVSRVDKTSAFISFPVNEVANPGTVSNGVATVGIDKDIFGSIIDTVNKFVNLALWKEVSSSEFCPLTGYDFDSLRNDLKTSIKEKRNLVFIDTYQSYLDSQTSADYTFNQYEIKYGSSEWADAIILIETDKLKELKKWISPLLKEKCWF